MRPAVLALLLANLLLFAGSQWLSPAAPSAPAATGAANVAGAPAGMPARILLASERPISSRPSEAGVANGAVASGPAEGFPAAAEGLPIGDAMATAGAGSTATLDGMRTAAMSTPAAVAGLSGAGASAGLTPRSVAVTASAEERRCVSMGPFTGLDMTSQATAMLKQDGYEPRQRPANGAVPDGFMVMVGPLKGEADQARVIGRLSRGGLDDAFALPKLEDGYAVSVGLFSQRLRAESRVLAVERIGLKAGVVERTRPGTVYWIDFDLKTRAGDAGALDPLLKTADPSQKWRVAPCPQPRSVG